MVRINCNYCGGRLREKEIYLRYNKKYWCDSCLSTEKSRKMKCPGCNKKSLAFAYETTRSMINCTSTYCSKGHLTWITYHHDHPQFPEIIGVIHNGRSEKYGIRNSEFN